MSVLKQPAHYFIMPCSNQNVKMMFFDLEDQVVRINYKTHQECRQSAINEIKLRTNQADIRIDTSDLPKNRMKLSHVLKYL
jgi:hypothetical protein